MKNSANEFNRHANFIGHWIRWLRLWKRILRSFARKRSSGRAARRSMCLWRMSGPMTSLSTRSPSTLSTRSRPARCLPLNFLTEIWSTQKKVPTNLKTKFFSWISIKILISILIASLTITHRRPSSGRFRKNSSTAILLWLTKISWPLLEADSSHLSPARQIHRL